MDMDDRNTKAERRILELEQSLAESHLRLNCMVGELEVKNEELLSNDAEIQAINEELHEANVEYQKKIDELERMNEDFDNLLLHAEIGALYIDSKLRIRKITPILCKNTNISFEDIGKGVSKVGFMAEYPDFCEDIARCAQAGISIEKEVDREGIIWLIRLRPYYSSEIQMQGILVTLFDITKRLEASKYELKLLTDSIPGGMARMRYENGLVLEYANDGFYKLMHRENKNDSRLEVRYYHRVLKKKDWEKLQGKIEESIQTGKMICMEYEVCHEGFLPEWRLMQAMILKKERVPVLQCIITDITEQKTVQRQMDSLIQNMAGGIIRINYDGQEARITFLSDVCCDILGYSAEEAQELHKRQSEGKLCIRQEYSGEVLNDIQNARKGKSIPNREYRLRRRNGQDLWIESRGEEVSRSDSELLIQYIILDITKNHEAFEEMRKERKKLSIIAEISADLLFEYDIQTDSMTYKRQRESGLNAEQIVGNYLETIQAYGWIHPEDEEELKDFVDQMRGGKRHVHTELRKRYEDKTYRWVEVDGRTVYSEDGRAESVIGKICDIDERKKREEKLKHNSERDSLTGLYNHMESIERIRRQLRKLRQGERYYFIICDLDNFKQVNDNNGHLFGDAALCTLADEIKALFPGCVAGRIGGDEFIVLVRNREQEVLEAKLDQLNNRLHKLNPEDTNMPVISCSIGVAVCTYEQHEYEKAFQFADYALYQVKNGQKGSFMFVNVTDESPGLQESYLSRQAGEEYRREEALIRSDEELVLFSLELLDNVEDIRTGLKMVSDRICRYFGLDDIVFLNQTGEEYHMFYHWGVTQVSPFASRVLMENGDDWRTVEQKFDEQGIAVLTKEEMEVMEGKTMGALLFIKSQVDKDTNGIVVFIDRVAERSWGKEKNTLFRLSTIIYNRIRQLQEEEKQRVQIDFQMNYDSVTGLPHYSKFLLLCEQYLQERKDRDYYFAYADFSNFQYLNEVYGYSAGDAVLRRFAQSLRDEAPSGIYFSRVTSDHFVGLIEYMPGYQPEEGIEQFLDDFCKKANQDYALCNLKLTCGICRLEKEMGTISTAVDYANVARKYGKNIAETKCILYTAEIRERNETEMAIAANMSKALENQEFQVYLQPKVSLKYEVCVGAEALIRWQKPDGSMIYPDQFIPVFERNGFVTKIDFFVLEQVLKYLREAIDKEEQVVPVSVNFSRLHNEEIDFVRKIIDLIEKYQIDPGLIEVEVTESVYMYDLSLLENNIRQLQEYGVKISIDDFGSGYSSLNVLARISADIIKIDKQFLNCCEDSTTPGFMKYLIKMIKHLGFEVIAEGVETKEQARMLKEASCDMVQGYYYARPMPIDNFRQFLQKKAIREELE